MQAYQNIRNTYFYKNRLVTSQVLRRIALTTLAISITAMVQELCHGHDVATLLRNSLATTKLLNPKSFVQRIIIGDRSQAQAVDIILNFSVGNIRNMCASFTFIASGGFAIGVVFLAYQARIDELHAVRGIWISVVDILVNAQLPVLQSKQIQKTYFRKCKRHCS